MSLNGRLPESLYAAGFNAHGQLDSTTTEDVKTFQPIAGTGSARSRVLFAGWSTTVIVVGDRIRSVGHQKIDHKLDLDADAGVLKSAIGDHDGMLACLDEKGRLYVVEKQRLVCKSMDASPRIGYLAQACNDRIAMTAMQTPEGQVCHLTEFDNFEKFIHWYEDPSRDSNYPASHHMLPGRPKSLQANVANFLLLMERGDVWTWGDSRYQSLGRDVAGDGAVPAHRPGAVEALGGISIKLIAAGGWQAAALSEDGALYIWGAQTPGSEHCIKALIPSEVSLLTIPGNADDEPLDILDVGIGSGHIAVLTEGNALYVAGQNNNGQLGIGREDAFVHEWQAVMGVSRVQEVICAPMATIIQI